MTGRGAPNRRLLRLVPHRSWPPAAQYLSEVNTTIQQFEQAGIAVFPAPARRKGTYVEGWPEMSAADALALARAALPNGRINLAGRTGAGWAVLDLDARGGVEPGAMLSLLLQLLGPAVFAVVRTNRGFHIWVRVSEPVGNGFCSFIGGEIFSAPHLAMLPPSIHPEGLQYAWVVEPRLIQACADLKALGLVPDEGTAQQRADRNGHERSGSRRTPAPAEVQQDFARLMADAGVVRKGTRAQSLTRCRWHADNEPSLSVNWDAAVFYCFSEHCDVRGGIQKLRQLVNGHTPSYRQRDEVDGGDQPTGDKLGCVDLDAETERLAAALEQLGLDRRARSVRDCRKFFRVGKCGGCGRTPAYPISCGDPLCVRCMPGRLEADWARHAGSLPDKLNLLRLRPRDFWGKSSSILKRARSRFSEWRVRAGVEAGVYGARLDRTAGAVILLGIPSDLLIPKSSRAFEVETVAVDRSPHEFLSWLQVEYVEEARSWETAEELSVLVGETRGRRRFQGFGAAYGRVEVNSDVKANSDSAPATEAKSEGRKPLGRVSGGSLKGKHPKEPYSCPFCGGAVELYSFSVPAAQVERVGSHWLWRGPTGSPIKRAQ